jgi:lipopolysaccharide export LptBFGC system permease protein LptF
MAHLELSRQVTLTDVADPAATITKDRESFRAVALPESIRAQVKSTSDRELLDASSPIGYAEGFAKKRTDIVQERGKLLREIAGVIHSRLALSISTFVLVTLGAALGIVFRNSHAFTAFGISFVPSLFVIVTIIMGRQLAQNAGTAAMGIAVIWGGIALVGGVDVWTLTRLVRR